MTKCRIEISTNKTFDSQESAREYLKALVHAGVLFVRCWDANDKTKVSAGETTIYQTQTEAKIALKNLTDAGILFLEVKKGHKDD